MSHTVALKLNKPARENPAGQEGVFFSVSGGVKYYDRKDKVDKWTNYEASLYAKAGPQAEYYRGALVEGAVVVVSGKSLAVREYQTQTSSGISLVINDAYIGYIVKPASAQDAPQPQRQAPAPAAQQRAPAMHDSDIPF
jgi:single-strand DNA-binding protein